MTKNNSGLNKKQKLYAIIAASAAIVAIIVMLTLFFATSEKNYEEGKVKKEFEFLVDEESSLLENVDIFAEQKGIYESIMKEYEKGNYTIDKPYVIGNPFKIAPQTALVLFRTSKSEKVTLTIKGKHNDDIVRTFESTKDHYIPVYGLYNNYENEVKIKTESGKETTLKIKIDDIFQTAAVDVAQNKIENSNGEFYFTTSSLGSNAMAYDNYGETRWHINRGYNKGITMLQNGNLLISTDNNGPDVTSTSGVVEINMLGQVIHEYEIEGGYHHDAYELESGNLIILTTKMGSDSFADHVVEIDRETGKVSKEWNLRDIVTKVDSNLLTKNDIAWGWLNSVTFDKKNNALILSVRNQNSVVSIDYNSGNINWILGEKKYWSNKFSQYLLTGTGAGFLYPSGQHSVNITKDGKLSIFNNGYNANNEVSTPCSKLRNSASYAMVYDINLENKTATVDYKFGGQQYFSYALSSYTYTSDNHKIFNSGWHFTNEVDYNNPECTQFTNDKYDAYLIEFDENNNIILDMHIAESKFEVVKADIYSLSSESVKPMEVSDTKNFEFVEGKYLSTYNSDNPEELSEEDALKYAINDPLYVSFELYNNRFKLFGSVPSEMEMKVTFISPSGKAYRYTMKEANKDIKEFVIIDKLPKGRYYVYVNLGNEVYNTTQYIDLK